MNVTTFSDAVLLKFVPVIVTTKPSAAASGVKLVMVGVVLVGVGLVSPLLHELNINTLEANNTAVTKNPINDKFLFIAVSNFVLRMR